MDKGVINFRLADLRRAKHMTQSELAEVIGTSFQNISKWENGKRYPQLIWVYEIADKLGVSIEDLVCDK